jgi:hypothetical protein
MTSQPPAVTQRYGLVDVIGRDHTIEYRCAILRLNVAPGISNSASVRISSIVSGGGQRMDA